MITLRAENALPDLFSRRVAYSTQGAQSLADTLDGISTMAGVAVQANEIAGQQGSPQDGGAGLTGKIQIDFNGTLRGLLDELANRNNASWRYTAKTHRVEFFRYETRTLSVHLPAGAKSIAASINLQGVSGSTGGAGAGSAGTVSVSQNLTVDPWGSIMSGVQSILGSSGADSAAPAPAAGGQLPTAVGQLGRASANPAFGIITVTARPVAVERIASYINSINQRFAQNVMIDIKIFNVTLDDQASLGFSLDLLYQKLNRAGVSVVGAAPLQAGTGTPGQITLETAGGRWSGSQVMAQALSQFGNVSLQTQGQVLAINGQPSPIQVANEVNYLASSATTTAANVGTTSTLTPGTKVVGFTANFLPLILGDNRILLQYQMQISALTALTQVSSGTSSIQTPQISSQSLQQQAFVRDGQAIVLFGFDQARDTANTAAGLGSAAIASRSERSMVVIVMQVNGGAKDV
jgi:type IVB pilus formation R64 PilN family outer membrane protein